ncbi:acyl carrier protein [Neisseria elongata]|uniref:acyl carrier protein n=1 Tax=Neisseria elongata TaxID=495 RepID=UPI0028D3926A|nr:acyl carrier protein [Neisseria elongata]
MTENEIRAFLFDILENMFEIDTGNVTGSTNLYEDLEIDSIDAIDLLDQIKRQTGYKLQAEDFRNVRTIDDIIAAVSKLYQEAKPEA